MELETARLIFYIITPVMFAICLAGTLYALSKLRRPEGPYGPGDPAGQAGTDIITGETLIKKAVEGGRESVSKKTAELLLGAVGGAGQGLVKITERTSDRIVFEMARGTQAGYGRRSPQAMSAGLITLEDHEGGIRLRYAVDVSRFSRIMRLVTYLTCFLYGGAIVVAVPICMWIWVVNSEDPGVRVQAIQTAQMVHGVWPPFLMGFLTGRVRKTAAVAMGSLLANVKAVV
jgi:hypothetical protein